MQTLDDSQERLPEIGYRLQKSSWGRGFATEAATAIRDYAIHTMKLNPVNAFIDLQNTRSQSVAKKLGFSPTVQACFKGSNIQVWSYTLLN
jgi:[ribosomal protein S5]-alanine N-acetyltransferase